MSIEFEDGSKLEAQDWSRIMSLVKQRAKEGKPKATKIEQGGVTVNVKGLEVAQGKLPEYSNYVESKHKDWKIRVWRIEKDKVYGCNYFRNEEVYYLEVPFGDVRDENGVFKYASSVIEDM
jgi:hypothetical protein